MLDLDGPLFYEAELIALAEAAPSQEICAENGSTPASCVGRVHQGLWEPNVREAATITFRGTLDPARFCAFIDHRARRLSLDAQLGVVGPEAVTVTVEGEPDLIDAFEMACSLGPADCLVRDVERRPPALSEGLA